MSKFNIADESHLNTLDAQLKDNLFIGGASPSAEDALVFEQFAGKPEPNQDKHINLWSWFNLMILFHDNIRASWKSIVPAQAKQQAAPKKVEKKASPKKETKKEEKDECDDLFGDDGDDAAALEEMKKKKEADKKAATKNKAAPVQKSIIILDVKVWEPEQDLDALAAKILKIEKEGLMWKTEYKLADVAFGVKKLVIGLVVEDEKVSVDDIIDELESWEDDVQSVDIVSFNKI
jgi:elongation factor 1-beta